jgi:uncharacterized OB-fold protein
MTNHSKAPPARRVRPLITEDTAFFWAAVGRGVLAIQRCDGCGTLRHPPAPMCPHCQSLAWQAAPMSGRGRVHSFTVVHHPAVPPFVYPNAIALIELEEGVRLLSQLVGIAPADIALDLPVAVSFETVEDGLVLPLFRPAQEVVA